MSAETTRYLELLEERLALLGSLADALTAARTDIVSLDITGLEARIADQEKLCTKIRSLDSQLDRVQRQCTTHMAPASVQLPGSASDSDAIRRRETLDRLTRVQASVKQLNDEHRALLRRSRRTVSALLNSYRSFAMTYSNPSDVLVSAGERL
jgi:FlgN protein